MDNDVYEQDFVQDCVEINAVSSALSKIAEVHSPEHGWSISEPEITPNPDGRTVTLKVHLTCDKSKSYGRTGR